MAKKPSFSEPAPTQDVAGPVVLPMQSPMICIPVVLSPQNESALASAMRRIRELLLDAQKHHADGSLIVDLGLSNGQSNRVLSIHPRWNEKV